MEITIPQLTLPFAIPAMLHPVVVHFVIVLPFVVLLLEFINLFTKSRAVGVINFVLLLFTSLLLYGAYLTGSIDAKSVSDGAHSALLSHKQIGIYLFYGSLVVLLFKLVSLALQKGQVKFLYLLALIVFNAAMLNDAKKGADLVYEYGVNVKTQNIQANLNAKEAIKKEENNSSHQEILKEDKKAKVHQEEANIKKEEQKENVQILHETNKTKEEVKESNNTNKEEGNHEKEHLLQENESALKNESNKTTAISTPNEANSSYETNQTH